MRLSLPLTAALAPLLATASHPNTKDFTADDLISAPRPQAPIPNQEGTQAISVVDQWDPVKDRTTRSVYLVALNTDNQAPVELFTAPPAEAGEFFWLTGDLAAYINGTSLYSFRTSVNPQDLKARRLFDFPAGISATGLQYEHQTGHLAFTAQVWEHGAGSFDAVQELNEKFEERGNSGQVYDDLFIRHWDTWRIPGKVWTVGMTKIHKGINGFMEKPQQFINLLNATGLMDPPTFAISPSHVAISVKAPRMNNAFHTREDVYILDVSHPHSVKPAHLTPHNHGAISGLTFSPDGSKLAWLEMALDGYESDRRVVVVHDTEKATRWTDTWDRSPSSVTWSRDSKSIYLLAEHEGRVLPYHLKEAGHLPMALIFNHTTTSISVLPKDLLLSITSHTNPLDYYLLPKHADIEPRQLHRLTGFSTKHIDGRLDGLEGEEFWFEGDEGIQVMGWVNKPPGFKEGQEKKWPLAFLIHGGPQGAWEDSWSTRWNQAMFAAKGYITVAINPTGSTGYGQEFTDRIQGNWGSRKSRPYKDLVAGYHAALKLFPEIDPERTTALGASYGGYMINWLNGHNPGFKAMVCHDGIFSTTDAFYTTEEVWFPLHDMVGSPIDNRAGYEKWNPANHVAEWATPTLVIHSGKDFRLIEGAGIAAFTALQYQGVPSRFLYFPDENHWVLKPGNSKKWHAEVFKWLDEWVGHGQKDSEKGLIIQ